MAQKIYEQRQGDSHRSMNKNEDPATAQTHRTTNSMTRQQSNLTNRSQRNDGINMKANYPKNYAS